MCSTPTAYCSNSTSTVNGVSDPTDSGQTASGQTGSHADAHDLDKLDRWKTGLSTNPPKSEDAFPIYAMFLVTGEDRDAHNVFRRFRSTFEELDAGFDNLIIFGQHGTSATMLSFLSELDLDLDRVPVLALTRGPISPAVPVSPAVPISNEVLTITLPKGTPEGDSGDNSGPWERALELIAEASRAGGSPDLSELERVSIKSFSSGSLMSSIDRVLESLRPAE